jgi:hypothetical protein
MRIDLPSPTFRFGEYEGRYYPAAGNNLAGWRVFLRDEFVFSSERRDRAENWARSRSR